MQVVFVLAGLALGLLIIALVSGRRFGLLGLALCAGYVMYQLWQGVLAPLASSLPPLIPGLLTNETLAGLAVILLPSLVLMIRGPRYHTKWGRLLGALGYAVVATVFSLGALAGSLVLMGADRSLFEAIAKQQDIIMTATVAIAVVDVVVAYATPAVGKKSKSKKAS